jgi:dynein light intermediate chain 2
MATPASAPAASSGPVDVFALVTESLQTSATDAATAATEVLFVGSKGAGKTTLVNAFMQKDEPPKPSTPLEYKFVRRSAGASGTAVANIWELGGAAELSQLLKVVLQPDRLHRCVAVVTLDLSEPESALETLTQWLEQLRQQADAMTAQLSQSADGAATVAAVRKASAQLWADHPDQDVAAVEQVLPLGVPVVIVANKWDAFEEAYVEAEYRKCVCRTLRFFAHQAGASLLCTRHKDKANLTVLRNLLYHHVFGTASIKAPQLEHTKALVVPASADSFAAIGKPPTVDGVFADTGADKWRVAWEKMFVRTKDAAAKREAQDLTMVEAEQFAEEMIDELRRQKKDELLKQRKAAEFEAKMADAGAGMVAQ